MIFNFILLFMVLFFPFYYIQNKKESGSVYEKNYVDGKKKNVREL